jgi:hypothetical protein
MGSYIAQVTFQSNSGLSKDRFENVWHYSSGAGAGTTSEASGIVTKLSDFYTFQGSTGMAVSQFLSPELNRTVVVKVYDEIKPAGGAPRPILLSGQFDMPTFGPGQKGLPEEVAICLSYYSTANLPRHRGRIYLGPLNASVLEEDAQPRPTGQFLQCIADAATKHKQIGIGQVNGGFPPIIDFPLDFTLAAAYPAWSVRSGLGTGTKAAPVVTYETVQHGWIDNEWDGQSRRRVEASARVNW